MPHPAGIGRILLLAAGVVCATSAIATAGPVTGRVIAPPSPVAATDGGRHLVYEIVLHDAASAPVRIARLEVLDRRGSRVLASYGRSTLDRLTSPVRPGPGAPTRLRPGGDAVTFLDVTLPVGRPAPARLAHRLVVASAAGRERVVVARTVVDRRPPVRISPPLGGDRLLDAVGCCGASDHTRAVLEVRGRPVLAQRFAIDVVRLTDDGDTVSGDPGRNEGYAIEGAPVLAVAPGRVVAARDGLPENTPQVLAAGTTVATAPGNHVVEALGGGRFALYAHLQAGSVRVAAGQRVLRGQVLGLVGNTGESTEPHLHFQVSAGPSPLGANGLPFVIGRFGLQGRVAGLGTAAPRLVPAKPPPTRSDQMPLQGDVLAFG